jgi:uncharacterized protein YbaR (Trm112 family)
MHGGAGEATKGHAMLSKELLDILCCPTCKGNLEYKPDQETLTCTSCRTVYPVRNDIPIMLVEDESHRG